MMEWVREWLRNIIVIVLLATFADLLLPNSEMQKYAKMVLGLLVIITIISPILTVFEQFSMNEMIQNLEQELGVREASSSSYQENVEKDDQEDYEKQVLQRVEDSMQIQLQKLVEQKKMYASIKEMKLDAAVTNGIWEIAKLEVTVIQNNTSTSSEAGEESIKEVQTVKVTSIYIDSNNTMSNDNNKNEEDNQLAEQVKEIIQKEWSIEKEKITVIVEPDLE